MARTPLAQSLERAAASAAAESEQGESTRRSFLRQAGAAGLGLAALGGLAPGARATDGPKIVVVGAGLAGLTCAYRLKRAGYIADVYEPQTRLGGRCWSGRAGGTGNPFVQGQVIE